MRDSSSLRSQCYKLRAGALKIVSDLSVFVHFFALRYISNKLFTIFLCKNKTFLKKLLKNAKK